MKTAEEVLYGINGIIIECPINASIISAMKDYAKIVGEDLLKRASENSTLIYESDSTGKISHYGCTYGTEMGEVRVDRKSITSTKIITP